MIFKTLFNKFYLRKCTYETGLWFLALLTTLSLGLKTNKCQLFLFKDKNIRMFSMEDYCDFLSAKFLQQYLAVVYAQKTIANRIMMVKIMVRVSMHWFRGVTSLIELIIASKNLGFFFSTLNKYFAFQNCRVLFKFVIFQCGTWNRNVFIP